MRHKQQSYAVSPSTVSTVLGEVTEGEGIDILNEIPRKVLNKVITTGVFMLTSQGDTEVKPLQGRYKNFTFTVSNTGHDVVISFYGRPFAIIRPNNVVSPAPCLSNPEDTVRYWNEGTVDIIIEQLTKIIQATPDRVLA